MKKTIKLPINLSNNDQTIILNYQRNQNNVIRFTYNRLLENPKLTTAELTILQKTMQHVFIDSHFKNSANYKAKELIGQDNGKVIFGGKPLFLQRCHDKITSDDFQLQKLLPIYSIGEANQYGNRKFTILDNNAILFKPTKSEHIELQLPFLKKHLKQELEKVKILQDMKTIPITYQLDSQTLYLSYDDKIVNKVTNYHGKSGRIMAIDLNPNYIGYSIIDWVDETHWNLINNGVFDLTHFAQKSKALKHLKWELKQLGTEGEERTQIIRETLLHLNGQRDHETIAIAIRLFNLFRGFNCGIFGMEDLSIASKENAKGKNYNRLVINEWLRNCIINQLEKRLDRIGGKVIKIIPNYSSFVGNLVYASLNLPDPILASIEINRRAFEFHAQYMAKTKPKSKVIIFPSFETVKHLLVKPLEGFGGKIDQFNSWKRLYGWFKNLGVKYRVTLESVQKSRGFSTVCIKKKVMLYNFT